MAKHVDVTSLDHKNNKKEIHSYLSMSLIARQEDLILAS